MSSISAEQVRQLRDRTGVAMMECKKALDEANGDEDKAIELLRKRGSAKAADKATRSTCEGWIGSYVHANGKIGALVTLACETDFVARNEEFRALADALAMHVAASQPTYRTPQDVPPEVLEKEREIIMEQLKNDGKPESQWSAITDGKLGKYYQEHCLVAQLYIKDDKKTIEQLLTEAIQKLGENIEIKDFSLLVL